MGLPITLLHHSTFVEFVIPEPEQDDDSDDDDDDDDDLDDDLDDDDDDDLDDDDDDNNDPYCFSEDEGEFSQKPFANVAPGNNTRPATVVNASVKKEVKYER